MQNIVEFHIIGRLGRIDAAKKVTHISVATNYNRREGETWKSDPQWHRITLFDKMRDRLTNATIGDLVRITGRIGQSSYKVEGETRYSVDLIADGFVILAKAKVKTVEEPQYAGSNGALKIALDMPEEYWKEFRSNKSIATQGMSGIAPGNKAGEAKR